MSGLGRITQLPVEVIGPISGGNGRITQLYAEVIGPLKGPSQHGRITQLYLELIGPVADHARITQLYAEPIGPPGMSPTHNARITQLVGEAIGPPFIETPCLLPFVLKFAGNVSGLFYEMESMGSETVPTPRAQSETFEDAPVDTKIVVSTAYNNDPIANLTEDGTWITFNPLLGAAVIQFSNGLPVRTIWVVTNAARNNPAAIFLWASSQRFDLWKQECTP